MHTHTHEDCIHNHTPRKQLFVCLCTHTYALVCSGTCPCTAMYISIQIYTHAHDIHMHLNISHTLTHTHTQTYTPISLTGFSPWLTKVHTHKLGSLQFITTSLWVHSQIRNIWKNWGCVECAVISLPLSFDGALAFGGEDVLRPWAHFRQLLYKGLEQVQIWGSPRLLDQTLEANRRVYLRFSWGGKRSLHLFINKLHPYKTRCAWEV